ncbi:MAG: rubrerythrin family protein [Bacteroidales bacterium]|jgi:rubrerythrin|nr:rubrerythrin family protein [Bacteroidales bacterium]
MSKLIGSKTEKNLLKSFAGESQARGRYTMFAKAAKTEGYEQIAAIFMETAEQELQHAKVFFKYLESGENLEITAMFPAGKIGTTEENLEAAARGEREEWGEMYPEFAQVAEEEGFKEIATSFRMVAKVEVEHEKRYLKLLENVRNNKVFERDEEVEWMCRNCGYVHKGKKALNACPACKHPMAFFEIHSVNY